MQSYSKINWSINLNQIKIQADYTCLNRGD
jgi:hypothetical protein